MTRALEFCGRLHPFLLHLPIGMLVGLAVLELAARMRRSAGVAPAVLVWLAAGSAVLTAASGYLLSREEGYGGSTLEDHKRLGIAIASTSLLMAFLHGRARASRRAENAYRAALALAVLLLLPAGHLGSSLTRGSDWLTAPLRGKETTAAGPVEPPALAVQAPVLPQPAAPSHATEIAPIFATYCTTCHGETKHKGGLRLHRAALVLGGGEDGPVIVPGHPEKSEMVRRLRLPLEDEDHMPPEGKRQPGPQEIARIEAWIAAGAPVGDEPEPLPPSSASATPGESAAAGTPAPESTAPVEAPRADPQALACLAQALVHVEALGRDSLLLWVDFAAVATTTTDESVEPLLAPLVDHVGELALARSGITDETLELCARMPRLERLDLRATAVTDAGLVRLAGHATLAELVLAQTKLTDAAVEALQALPALREVNVWSAGLSGEALARLRSARPDLAVEAGDALTTPELETEPEIVLTGDRPLPGEEGKGAAAPASVLEPINATCPVSGKPVDKSYTIVFGGKVIGFCCPNCPKEFWSDPAKYEGKLR